MESKTKKILILVCTLIIILIAVALTVVFLNKNDDSSDVSESNTDSKESNIEEQHSGMQIFDEINKKYNLQDTIDDASESTSNQAVNMFNESFEVYLGQKISGLQAKSLISAVQLSNSKISDHQVKLIGVTTISKIKKDSKYNAIEKYDSKGYIKEITITEAN